VLHTSTFRDCPHWTIEDANIIAFSVPAHPVVNVMAAVFGGASSRRWRVQAESGNTLWVGEIVAKRIASMSSIESAPVFSARWLAS